MSCRSSAAASAAALCQRSFFAVRAFACTAVVLLGTALAAAGQDKKDRPELDVPRCAAPIATISIIEPATNWWEQLGQGFGSPVSLIKVFVDRSGCFTLVDRGAGLAAAQRERALASGGELQRDANVGQGQMVAADYVLVPNLVSSNKNSSGRGIGGIVGGLLGGVVGAVASGINTRKMTADVTLALTDVRTTRQLVAIEGRANKRDISFFGGGGMIGASAFGGAGLGGYNNTEIGKVITMAYLDAYAKLVDQMGGIAMEAPAGGGRQTVVMTRTAAMYEKPTSRSAIVRNLETGSKLFPTGAKDGLMWEVTDEMGAKGWVTSVAFRSDDQR
jgi:hypothetical protein